MKRLLTLIFSLGVFACGLLASENHSQLNGLQGLCANGTCSTGTCSTGTCATGNCSYPASSPQTYYSTPQTVSMPYASQNQTVYYSSTPVYQAAAQYTPVQYSNTCYGSSSYQQPIYYSSAPAQTYTSQPVVYPSQPCQTVQYQSVPCYSQPQVQYSTVQSYPVATSYPTQTYTSQSYPVQSYSTQSYPVQSYPVQTYPSQSCCPTTTYTYPSTVYSSAPVVYQGSAVYGTPVVQNAMPVQSAVPVQTTTTNAASDPGNDSIASIPTAADKSSDAQPVADGSETKVEVAQTTETAETPVAETTPVETTTSAPVVSAATPAATQPIVYQPAANYQPAISYDIAPVYGGTTYSNSTPTYVNDCNSCSYQTGGLAQRKATMAARMRLRGHVGGSLGSARYEGVGWSTVSPESAIQNCCYWGRRPAQEIGVCQGADGCWYACVHYQ